MGFLHLGWDVAAQEGTPDHLPGDFNSAWGEVAKRVDLARPGMAAVIRTMGWQPLHLAAMEGKVSLVKTLVQQLGCNILGRSANSWTPMHYAAAHNQVRCKGRQEPWKGSKPWQLHTAKQGNTKLLLQCDAAKQCNAKGASRTPQASCSMPVCQQAV